MPFPKQHFEDNMLRIFEYLADVRCKGLYAFLIGVTVFSVCCKGDLSQQVIDEPQEAENGAAITEYTDTAEEKGYKTPRRLSAGKETTDFSLSEGYRQHTETERQDEDILLLTDEIPLAEASEAQDANRDNVIEETNGTAKETDPAAEAESAEAEENNAETEDEEPEIVSKWQEIQAEGVMYVCTDGIYSREEAVEGAEKVKRYELNEKVSVIAKTDTEYYKLDNGTFIHSDYLSTGETPKWTETETSGLMYICRGGIYSREEAVEGAEKIDRYGLNDTVNVVAVTDTGYYKLDTGGFIHSDYLSTAETVEYPLSDRYGQRAQYDWEKDYAQQVVEITNQVRAEYGLAPLKQLDALTAAAAERAWETTFNMSHTRPDGTRCFSVLDQYGLSSPSAKGENIAMWSNTPQMVVNSWMNDRAHRDAILNAEYEYIGVGCYYIENDYYHYYWSQIFYTP